MTKNKAVNHLAEETVGQLSARFAAGRIPTEAAFYQLIDWAALWQQLFGWNKTTQTCRPGAGLHYINEHISLKVGAGIALDNRGLALKLHPQGGLLLDEQGALQVDGTVAVSADAFAVLPEDIRRQIVHALLFT